jgi:hypothetical protein
MRHRKLLGHSLAAGALAGAALAPLQFLLWSEQQIAPCQALLGLVAWSSWGALWLGAVTLLALELATLGAASRLARRGFSIDLWRGLGASVGLAVALLAAWNHRETKDLLLPANRQALEVLGALAAIYAVTLVVLAVRRPVWRHPLLASSIAAALFLCCCWGVWVATPPPPRPAVPDEIPRFKASAKLLLVSWEGTDLAWLLPEMERGDMPFLRSRFEKGAWGQLRTVRPYTRSASLATLATGCTPDVHGVVGRRAYRIPWLVGEPVTLLLSGPWRDPQQLPWGVWERVPGPSPRRAAVWQVLAGSGAATGTAGWSAAWSPSWRVPPPLAAESRPFQNLDDDLQAALKAGLAAVPDSADNARAAIASSVEQHTRTLGQIAAHPVDALVVDSSLASRVRPFFTARSAGDPAEDVLRQAARLLDGQLAGLWKALGDENALLVVASPYGLAAPSPWQRLVGIVGLRDRWRVSPEESPDGFVLLSGPDVRPGTRLRPRRLVDVVPTVLYLLELPVARDMAGGVILEAVSDEHATRVPLRRVASYPAPAPSRQ